MERWIPVDIDLYRKPKFVALCRAMQASRYEAAGRVLAVWFWVQSYGPTTALDASGVDEATGTPPGTTEALIASGWATAKPRSGGIRFHWPGQTLAEIRERRSASARRAASARWHRDDATDATAMRPHCDSNAKSKSESKTKTKTKTKPKREPPLVSQQETDAEASASGCSSGDVSSSIRWSRTAGFEGVRPEDRTVWAKLAPGVDIDAELDRAHAWLYARPERRRPNILRFLTDWFKNRRPDETPPAKLTKPTGRGTLPFGCYWDADGVARTASGARLDRPGDDR